VQKIDQILLSRARAVKEYLSRGKKNLVMFLNELIEARGKGILGGHVTKPSCVCASVKLD
jgi:hypothetical protein